MKATDIPEPMQFPLNKHFDTLSQSILAIRQYLIEKEAAEETATEVVAAAPAVDKPKDTAKTTQHTSRSSKKD